MHTPGNTRTLPKSPLQEPTGSSWSTSGSSPHGLRGWSVRRVAFPGQRLQRRREMLMEETPPSRPREDRPGRCRPGRCRVLDDPSLDPPAECRIDAGTYRCGRRSADRPCCRCRWTGRTGEPGGLVGRATGSRRVAFRPPPPTPVPPDAVQPRRRRRRRPTIVVEADWPSSAPRTCPTTA